MAGDGDTGTARMKGLRGILVTRTSTALIVAGLVIVSASVVLSVYVSSLRFIDGGPRHDALYSIPILAGLTIFIVGAALRGSRDIIWSREIHARLGPFAPATVAMLTGALVGFYALNPLVSPIGFFHDSDLDYVQDYSDDYPLNCSRVDYPWAAGAVNVGVLYYSNNDCVIGPYSEIYSFWLDAVAIEVTDENDTALIERTSLQDLGEEVEAEGVSYVNTALTDRLDAGDCFLLEGDTLGEGTRFMLWIYDGSWWCCATVIVTTP